jgi:hypothetical protein
VAVFEDAGISGAKGRDKRPGLDLKDATRRKLRWSWPGASIVSAARCPISSADCKSYTRQGLTCSCINRR